MTETTDGRPRLGEISEPGAEEYKPLSGLAVAGLVFGLLSPLAFLGPLLYVFGMLGIAICVAALVRIGKDSPAITGRRLALAGLVLSVLCLSIAPSHRVVSRYLVRNEARQFASAWFQFLSNDEPQKAYQLSRLPKDRAALDDKLWEAYADDGGLAAALSEFVENGAVRALLALGGGAQVRFYETQSQGREYGEDSVTLLYAVTFEEEGKKTFFVGLKMTRLADAGGGRADWYINDVHDYARPAWISG